MTPSFSDLRENLNPDNLPRDILICFDPGETTGYCLFHGISLVESGQLDTKDLEGGTKATIEIFQEVVRLLKAQSTELVPAMDIHVVIEDYRVYGWKTEQHAFASLHTPKFIGCIIACCVMSNLTYTMQMAHQAKQFCTDVKLRDWGFYQKGQRHARDAIRHGCYYTLFNKRISS